MSSEIVAAFNAAFPDGPSSSPTTPDKSMIRAAGVVIQSSVDASSAGILRADNLSQLNATPGTHLNQPGQVFNDGANTGEYRWNGAAWVRVGDLINAAEIQSELDERPTKELAGSWEGYFNDRPIILDQFGVYDGTARVYFPLRKFFARNESPLDVITGTANALFPGYEARVIDRYRPGDTAPQEITFYYDLDNPTAPLVRVDYPDVPPLDKPWRAVQLLTISTNGFYSSPVRVIEMNKSDTGQIWAEGAIVHDGESVLIPRFYQYHDGGNLGFVQPTTGKFFEFSATEDAVQGYWYDNVVDKAGGTAIKQIIGGNNFPNAEGYRNYCIARKGGIGSNNVISSEHFPVANIVKNQWRDGKYPDEAARLLTNDYVTDAPAALVALGFTRCVKSTDTDIYYGGDIGQPTRVKTKVFARFYLHTTATDDFGSGPYLVHFWKDETFLGNVTLAMEKKINSNVAIFSGMGAVGFDGANRFYVGPAGMTAGTHAIAGGQVWFGDTEWPWISRDDYAPEYGSMRPIIGKDIWAVSGRPLPYYPKNTVGLRDDFILRSGFYTLKGTDKYPHFVEGDEQLLINPDLCGTTGKVVSRLLGPGADKTQRLESPVTIHVAPATKTAAKKVLLIGDSLTNAGLARRVDAKLTAMGITATWLGTINSTDTYFSENATDGLPGEGRGGREFGDHTHALTVKMTVPTSVAAYNAANKTTKVGLNPFIRPSTGSDPANLIFNGYVFDFSYYITNYLGGVNPDIVIIGLGTNDRVFETDAVAVQNALDGIRVMMTQIRDALPSAMIAWWIPPGPESNALDGTGAWVRQQKVIRAVCSWVLTNGDANMHIIPAWAHVSSEIGWWLNATPTIADNVARAQIADTIHPGPDPSPIREQYAETLFAYIANVA